MKLGANESKKTWIAIALAVVAVFMTGRMIIGNLWAPETTSATSTPVATSSAATRRAPIRRVRPSTKQSNASGPVTPSLDPRLRLDVLKDSETIAYTGEGRNIFRAQAEDVIQKPIASAIITKKEEPPPPPPVYTPPPPPPIPLRFFGFANQEGVKSILLSSNEGDVFVAREGEIVMRRYKVVKINPTNVEIMDVLNNNQQTIPLTAG